MKSLSITREKKGRGETPDQPPVGADHPHRHVPQCLYVAHRLHGKRFRGYARGLFKLLYKKPIHYYMKIMPKWYFTLILPILKSRSDNMVFQEILLRLVYRRRAQRLIRMGFACQVYLQRHRPYEREPGAGPHGRRRPAARPRRGEMLPGREAPADLREHEPGQPDEPVLLPGGIRISRSGIL